MKNKMKNKYTINGKPIEIIYMRTEIDGIEDSQINSNISEKTKYFKELMNLFDAYTLLMNTMHEGGEVVGGSKLEIKLGGKE